MTIEINHANSEYIYRQNPFQPREIDRRLNRHRARWVRFAICVTEESARKTLFKLQQEEDSDE